MKKPIVIFYPLDYFRVDNIFQMRITLNEVIRRVSIASLWIETRPEEAGQQTVQDYLGYLRQYRPS